MAETRKLLTSHLSGWRMAGPGGFRRVGYSVVESYGGCGLFWYADEVFEDLLLTVNGVSLSRKTALECFCAARR